MTEHSSATEITIHSWNLLSGGIDGADETRRLAQLAQMASWGSGLLWITEATGWHLDHGRRFRELAEATGMEYLPPVASHVGDGHNQSALYYRPSRLDANAGPPGAVGAFHHGLMRAVCTTPCGDRFLVLGTHLAYSSGVRRLEEAHHLADYGAEFGPWPDDAVLVGDMNFPDRRDTEPESWDSIPQNLHHRYREINADASFGGYDRRARDLLLASGWRDAQDEVAELRAPTTGHWYDNERVDMRLDQAYVTGDRIEVIDYRTHVSEELDRLSDHRPVELQLRLNRPADEARATA
ncbi:endonuclease/exonuclease/phosphatase family protein [Streptomyces sp. NPDC055078]